LPFRTRENIPNLSSAFCLTPEFWQNEEAKKIENKILQISFPKPLQKMIFNKLTDSFDFYFTVSHKYGLLSYQQVGGTSPNKLFLVVIIFLIPKYDAILATNLV
jgi:hypothetical protein